MSQTLVHPTTDSPLRTLSLGEFYPEHGGVLPHVRLAVRTWGELNGAKDNAILVLHALTGSTRVCSSPQEDGWWDDLVGIWKPVDTRRSFVISINMLGGCYGSTGPASTNPETGQSWGTDFPAITLRDAARIERRVIEAWGIKRLDVLGGSLGGARALEWALVNPDMVRRAVVVASSAVSSAEQIALGSLQIEAIRSDPAYRDGHYSPQEQPAAGLGLARKIAHLSYRSEAELDQRFAHQAHAGERISAPTWGQRGRYGVESYLDHQADKLVARFDAHSYVALTQALMAHDVGRGRGGVEAALAASETEFLIASVDSDRLYLPEQSARLARLTGARHLQIQAPNGHDGFLTHIAGIAPEIGRFLRLTSSR